jgi:hypothetical protein
MTTAVDDRALTTGRWPTMPLSKVVDKLLVGLPISRHAAKPGTASRSFPVLSVGDIEDGRVAPAEVITKVDLRPADFERFQIHSGDLLVSCRGTVLKVAPVLQDLGGALASSNIIIIRPDDSKVVPQIVLAVLRSAPGQEIIRSRTRSGTGLMQLTVKDLQDLPIPQPPLDIQKRLAELVTVAEVAYRSAIDAASMRRALVDSFLTRVLLEPSRTEEP